MRLLAIDPGPTESAYCVIAGDLIPQQFGKVSNDELLAKLSDLLADRHVIEQIGHYGSGMPAGRDVFDTCVWIGRYVQRLSDLAHDPELIERRHIKLHHCRSSTAKDSNVVQALRDRFAPGQGNYGKGTKDAPGWFYGFHSDIWQAYALAVYAAEMLPAQRPAEAEAVLL